MQHEHSLLMRRNIPRLSPVYATRVAAAIAFVPLAVLIILLIQDTHIDLSLTNTVVVFASLGLFTLTGVLAEDFEQDATIAYINLPPMIVWLTLGLAPALAIVIVGALLTTVLRQQAAAMLGLSKLTASDMRFLELRRVAASGSALLLVGGVYSLLKGMVPLTTLNADNVSALLVALPIAFIISKFVESLLVMREPATPLIFDVSRLRHGRQIVEIFLLPMSVALSIVVYNTPPGVFVIIMILLGLQALRQHQVGQAQRLLTRRVQELSLINTLGQRLSRSLLLEDLIQSLHIQISAIVPISSSCLVIYDDRSEIPDYYAILGGEPVRWSGKKAVTGPVMRTIRHRTLQYASPVETKELQAEGFDTSYFKGDTAFIGLPLLVESKAIGAIVIISDERQPTIRPDQLEWLQNIATQTTNAVQNAVNYTQTTLLVEQLALINRAVPDILFNLDREDALGIACESIKSIANASKVAVFTIDVEEQQLKLAKEIGLTKKHRKLIEHQTPDFATTTTRVIPDMNDIDPNTALRQHATAGKFQACVMLPLQSGNMVIGMVAVYHDEPYHYNHSMLDLLETLASLITAMLDNTQLFQALETYAFEMTQLANLSRTATSSLELDRVVDEVAQVFSQLINVNRVVVAALMPNNQRFKILGAAGQDAQGVIDSSPPEDTYLPPLPELEVFRQDEVPDLQIFYQNDENFSPPLQEMIDQYEARSLAFVPIVMEHTVLGVVMLAAQEERRFMPREWHLIEAATNQIAAHVHNALLFDRTQRALDQRLEELSLIENIARQISGELNVSQIIANVLDAAMRSTGADLAGLAMLTQANEFLILSRRQDQGVSHRALEFSSVERGIMGRVFREERVIITPDNDQENDYVAPDDNLYLSSMAIPLYREDQVVGVLNVESYEADFFREEQAGFLSSLGDHAVISMANAQLLEDRQHRIEMLTRLRDLTLQLSVTTDSQAVATAVIVTALNLIDGAEGGLYRYDLQSDDLMLLATASRHVGGQVEYGDMTGIVRKAAENGSYHAGHGIIRLPDQDDEMPCSIIAIPIKTSDEMCEVLSIAFTDERQIQPRELNTLELLASQAAGHLENAMLHERIRAGNNRMRAILDSTRDGVILLDRAGKIIESNPSADRLLGINLENYVGHFLWETLLQFAKDDDPKNPSHDELRRWARDLRLEPEGITRHEFTRYLHDTTVYLQAVGSPVWDTTQNVVGRLLTLRDITEAKELEAYRRGLTGMVVHDLRSPLSSIVSSLSFVGHSLADSEDTDAVRMVGAATQRAEELIDLVGMILDIDKLESGNFELDLTEIPVDEFVNSAIQTLEGSFQEAEIDVRLEIPDDLPNLWIDQGIANLQRVLVNILANAYKYTPRQSDICVSVELVANKPQVTIRVADSGPGIPQEQRRRIFESFEQIDGQKAERGTKGTGLGLSFSKLAIEAHGGRIWVDDGCQLSGACIAFTVPTMTPS